tara:strand:- start:101 stop:286 length:186 start_codon:yes stop_codon:yes gene_type:complete
MREAQSEHLGLVSLSMVGQWCSAPKKKPTNTFRHTAGIHSGPEGHAWFALKQNDSVVALSI